MGPPNLPNSYYLSADLIEMFKIIKGYEGLDEGAFFKS